MFSGSNKEQLAKWIKFKKRNLLRKLDLGLNSVQLTSEELKKAPNDLLITHANSTERPKRYAIEVPPPDEEFPGDEYSAVFPLPISHENQCTNYGVASNLDLFTSEFGFHTINKSRNLSIKKNNKEFNIDHAYERYAFVKALDHHRKIQASYEQVLRGQTAENLESEIDDESLFVDEDVDYEDSESDSEL